MAKQWWETFFQDDIGDLMFGRIPEKNTLQEIETVITRARLKPGMKILDLACGRGRHSLELAKRGFQVTGLDYSKPFLREAKRLATQHKVSAHAKFIHGDMRKIRDRFAPNSFDAVVSLYNSFGYFDRRSDDLKVIAEISRVLKPGGLLILNTLNRGGVEYRLSKVPALVGLKSSQSWNQLGKTSFFLDQAKYDAETRSIDAEWWFIDAQKRQAKRYDFRQNVYSAHEMASMLQSEKLALKTRWGRLHGGRFTARSWHQTIVAQKR